MDPLDLVKLKALMERTSGNPEVKIGLVDGPVIIQHPDLAGEHLRARMDAFVKIPEVRLEVSRVIFPQ
jgi:hypothetical protein